MAGIVVSLLGGVLDVSLGLSGYGSDTVVGTASGGTPGSVNLVSPAGMLAALGVVTEVKPRCELQKDDGINASMKGKNGVIGKKSANLAVGIGVKVS